MLKWLADPRHCEPSASEQGLRFLLKHGSVDALGLDFHPNTDFDDTGGEGYPLFYWKTTVSYRSIMSPVTRFILDRLERYHDGELRLNQAVPLIMCKRSVYGRFCVPKRRTKDFCSNSCRTLNRQELNPEAWAEYIRDYRGRNYKK